MGQFFEINFDCLSIEKINTSSLLCCILCQFGLRNYYTITNIKFSRHCMGMTITFKNTNGENGYYLNGKYQSFCNTYPLYKDKDKELFNEILRVGGYTEYIN